MSIVAAIKQLFQTSLPGALSHHHQQGGLEEPEEPLVPPAYPLGYL